MKSAKAKYTKYSAQYINKPAKIHEEKQSKACKTCLETQIYRLETLGPKGMKEAAAHVFTALVLLYRRSRPVSSLALCRLSKRYFELARATFTLSHFHTLLAAILSLFEIVFIRILSNLSNNCEKMTEVFIILFIIEDKIAFLIVKWNRNLRNEAVLVEFAQCSKIRSNAHSQ
jgi:hypothetical protein